MSLALPEARAIASELVARLQAAPAHPQAQVAAQAVETLLQATAPDPARLLLVLRADAAWPTPSPSPTATDAPFTAAQVACYLDGSAAPASLARRSLLGIA